MSFTWNGLEVNKIIPVHAAYSISESLLISNTASTISSIEEKVKFELALHISQQIVQLMDIDIEKDSLSLKRTYHGKTYMAITNPPNYPESLYDTFPTSSFNGFSATELASHANVTSVVKNSDREQFRVCEFTRDGKVTRVELQRYENGFWEKIPRVQIEE